MKLTIEKATDDDLRVIESDVCDCKGDIYGIVSRCASGFPRVVVLNPFKNTGTGELNGEALNNILWITCPAIHSRITQLEQSGVLERVRQLLASDRTMLNEMTNAHAHYYYFRKEVYRRITGQDYPEDKIRMFDSGIGGTSDAKQVDCLHVHYAHYMVCQSNIVGRAIDSLVNTDGCTTDGCRCRW